MNMSKGPLLVVEDVPNILDFLEMTLKFKGYEVVKARNGQEALDVIQNGRPAIIITDILMPKMDGFSLVYHLRTNPATRDIPVVFLSATYIAPEDKAFAMQIGATRFIEKPIDTEEFLLTVAELLTQGSLPPPPPLKEREFFMGYRKQLEMKLQQKNMQIARAERLIDNLPPEQKPGFETLRQQALSDRQEIQAELDRIREFLEQNRPVL
ncbi:MAG TPA: response regulator [Anaerolineales bacterium]|nr:response regulator [Anaerolineales bacterium]